MGNLLGFVYCVIKIVFFDICVNLFFIEVEFWGLVLILNNLKLILIWYFFWEKKRIKKKVLFWLLVVNVF